MKLKQLYVYARILWLKSSGAMENSCVYSTEFIPQRNTLLPVHLYLYIFYSIYA